MEVIGWIGAILFALCGIPQAWKAYKDGHSDGLSWSFLLMWFGGEVLTIAYVLTKSDVAPLLLNYILNLVCLLTMLNYKIFPRH